MQTYTDLETDWLQKTQNAGSTNTVLLDFFKRNLSARYSMAFSELTNYKTEVTKTASTVAAQQYYHLPVGVVDIEDVTVTVGGIAYPIVVVDSQYQWDYIQRVLISTSAIPTFIFPRRDDFGIWPIPQAVYTITFNHHFRDRPLGVADYTTGTVTATLNSTTITGSGTTWTAAMVNRWFIMNDPLKQGQGFPYRISAFSSTTSLTLETSYQGVTASAATYKIGEAPELPDEVHIHLSNGVVSDYYAGPRSDIKKATWFNNIFWTGDGDNSKRDGMKFTGGILGTKQRYSGRTDGAIVDHRPPQSGINDKNWGSSITSV